MFIRDFICNIVVTEEVSELVTFHGILAGDDVSCELEKVLSPIIQTSLFSDR
jgi:hypothetical protein